MTAPHGTNSSTGGAARCSGPAGQFLKSRPDKPPKTSVPLFFGKGRRIVSWSAFGSDVQEELASGVGCERAAMGDLVRVGRAARFLLVSFALALPAAAEDSQRTVKTPGGSDALRDEVIGLKLREWKARARLDE